MFKAIWCNNQISSLTSFRTLNVPHRKCFVDFYINSSHKSRNTWDKYPTMHHCVTEMCTYTHFCNKMVHCGIWDWCIVGFIQPNIDQQASLADHTARFLLPRPAYRASKPMIITYDHSARSWSYTCIRDCCSPSEIHLEPKSPEIPFAHTLLWWSFWNFAQSTAVVLPYSVQNFKTMGQLKRVLWTNDVSQDLSLSYV